ncbi:MAG: hypothetical protein ACO39X_05510, partial [Candidatus Nanopelagicaceae bacterium]
STESYASEYGCLYIVAADSIAEAQELAIQHYTKGFSFKDPDDIGFHDSRPIGVPMPGTKPKVVSHFVT